VLGENPGKTSPSPIPKFWNPNKFQLKSTEILAIITATIIIASNGKVMCHYISKIMHKNGNQVTVIVTVKKLHTVLQSHEK